jgi:uncharacterized protein HemY
MALNEVPKSGEVWCEGARICLRCGKWEDAKEYLNFAIRFTPQVCYFSKNSLIVFKTF